MCWIDSWRKTRTKTRAKNSNSLTMNGNDVEWKGKCNSVKYIARFVRNGNHDRIIYHSTSHFHTHTKKCSANYFSDYILYIVIIMKSIVTMGHCKYLLACNDWIESNKYKSEQRWWQELTPHTYSLTFNFCLFVILDW